MPGRKRDTLNTPVHAPDKAVQQDIESLEEANSGQREVPQSQDKIGGKLKSRSAQSIKKGGVNETQGEPPPGYGSVAPGRQGGGKR